MQYRLVRVSICILSSILNGMHCMVSFQHHTMIWNICTKDINNIQQELSTSHDLMLGHFAVHQLFCCLKSPNTRKQGGQRWCLVTRKRQFSYFSGNDPTRLHSGSWESPYENPAFSAKSVVFRPYVSCKRSIDLDLCICTVCTDKDLYHIHTYIYIIYHIKIIV